MVRQYDNYGRDQINIENLQGNATFNQTQIIQIAVAEIKTRPINTTSPYRGLKPFDQTDKDYFFGRDQFLTGLVNELEQTNVILLLGASGSGKSSVVRAGLIPWLSQKWGSRLIDLTLTPDQDPFEALYASLLKHYKQSDAQKARTGSADTLSQIVQTLKQPESFWLIFIDQFEELFTTSQPEQRDRFIQSLVQLSQTRSNDPSLKIVATMRADFLDRLDLAPANRLARITDKHRPLITQMHPDELRLAIEQPAAHHGVVLEAELVETIIKDVQRQAGYLPLLQYTLNRLWEEELQTGDLQQERTLHISTYWQLGGVRGALQKHVDTIYQRLQQQGRHLATQRIFLRLVEIGGDAESGTDWKPVRRRANLSEFKDEQEKEVLTQLIDEKLVVSDRDLPSQAQESTVEIAHEILLTSWTTLNTWIKENRQAIALRNRLNDDVARWQAKKSNDELWTGSKLEQVLELKQNPTFNQVLGGFSPTTIEFIDASVSNRDRQRRRTIVGLSVFSTVALGLATVSTIQYQRAELGQVTALQESADARFVINRHNLDGLLVSLNAAKHFQSLFWGNTDPQQQAKMRSILGRAVYWTREQNRLQGHQDAVQSVGFSPDGQMLATASYDKTVKLWRSDGTLLTTLQGHTQSVRSVSFSPDGQTIASASHDGTVRLWDRNGTLIRLIKAHPQWALSVQFSPDGQTLATGSQDQTVKLWQIDGRPLGVLKGHRGWVRQVIFSPDGKQIATISKDKTVKLWNRNGRLVRTLTGHQGDIKSVDFSDDSRFLATASSDQTMKLWSREGNLLRTFKHPEEVWSVNLSPDGKTIATGSSNGVIRLWALDGRLIDQWVGHQGEIPGLAFSPDGQRLATASNEGVTKLWHIHRNGLTSLVGHNAVAIAQFSPDGQQIASVGEDGLLKFWSKRGQLLATRNGKQGSLYGVAFSSDGQVLATAGDDATVNLWSRKGQVLKTLRGHETSVNSIRFSPDGKLLATGSNDNTAKLWNTNGIELRTFKGHSSGVFSVAFSPDGQRLATASDDQTVKLWNLDGTERKTLKEHTSLVWKATFSPDGQTIATASGDKTAKLWNLNGIAQLTLSGHTADVLDVSFSLDGQTIATASSDRTIKLWQRDGTLITTLMGHQAEVNSVNFSPDGQWLLSAGMDGTILLWNVSTLNLQGLIEQGCNQIRDYLRAHPDESRNLCQ